MSVPKLRFPEFEKSGDWEEKLFKQLYSSKGNNTLSRDKLNYSGGEVKNIHYGDIHTKFSIYFDIQKEMVPYINSSELNKDFKSENYCIEGDIIFADASEDLEDIGKCIEIIDLHGERVLSGLHTILARQITQKLVIGFGGYLFKSPWVRKQIQKESQGSKVLGLSSGRLANITISFPTVAKEQQKIADCLSSLDDLIAAHKRKLDSLKTHKQGLLQNLFPAEGETVPRLRFPEFENDGEWEEKIASNIFSLFQGFAFSSGDATSAGIRWLKIADVGMQKMEPDTPSYLPLDFGEKFDRFRVHEGEYVIALTRPFLNGQLKIARVDSIYHGSLLNQRVGKLQTNQEITFVYFLLQTEYLSRQIEANISGSEPPNLSTQQIEEILVMIPSVAEQQKIADCLSSLDEMISAEAQKIEALKVHKKALMQQLFPQGES